MTNARLENETGAVMNMPGGHVQTTAAPRPNVAVQLRRRHQAALRCEPLSDGRRDPWPTPRPAARTLHVECGARTAWLYGVDGQDVFALLDAAGVNRRQWDAGRKAWMVPIAHADDVMAFAEWRQRRVVTCLAVDR